MKPMTTDSLVIEAQKLVDAATPGPWTVPTAFHGPERYDNDHVMIESPDGPVVHHVYYDGHHLIALPRDSAFIAASRTLVPALLAALAESQRETAKMRAVYEAALAWRAFSQRPIVEANLTDGWSVHIRLSNAIDAAIATEVKP